MSIPALVSTQELTLGEELNGKEAIVDGFEGVIYIEPDEQTRAALEKKQAEDEEKKAASGLKGKEDITLDGHKIMRDANIGNIE